MGLRRDRTDWAFEENLFKQWCQKYRFDCEAFTDVNGDNCLLLRAKRFHIRDSYFANNVAGYRLWVNPPFRLLPRAIEHYVKCKASNATQTGAMFVIPDHYLNKVKHLLTSMQKVHTYPAGTQVFTAPPSEPGGPRRRAQPTKFSVHLYWDPPVQQPTRQEQVDSKKSALNKNDEGKQKQKKDTEEIFISVAKGQKRGSQLLVIKALINGKAAKVLIDGGATNTFIDEDFASSRNLQLENVESRNVKFADGNRARCNKVLKAGLIKHGLYRHRRDFLVIPLGEYDAILGKDWLDAANPVIDWPTNEVKLKAKGGFVKIKATDDLTCYTVPHLQLIEVGQLLQTCKQPGVECFFTCIRELEEETGKTSLSPSISTQPSPSTIDIPPDAPPGLRHALEGFESIASETFGLPPLREVNCSIPELPGSRPVCLPVRKMSPLEKEEAKRQIKELLERRLIRPSASPYGAPVLFVRKSDGTLRMCVDYRALNKQTVKDRFPIPRIDELLDNLGKAKVFSKLDLRQGYHQMRVEEQDIQKTAFRVPWGAYEYVVMGFGLCNGPSQFMRLMYHVLGPCIEKGFVVVYLDDILISSQNEEQHVQHLREVFECLKKHQLYIKLSKCQFFRKQIKYLGHVIEDGKVYPDPDKVKAVQEWPTPENQDQLMSFLGLANYYHKFIHGFAQLALPLTSLLGKQKTFTWTDQCQESFEALKHGLCSEPCLRLPDPDVPYYIVTDASDFAIGAVLAQDHGDGLQPVAYESRKLLPAERSYPVHEKELLAGVYALKKWRCYLEGTHFTWLTDAASLRYLQTQPTLTRRQARWVELLQNYDYTVKHIPGKQCPADPLSRRPDLKTLACKLQTIITEGRTEFLNKVSRLYENDPWLQIADNKTKLQWSGNHWFLDGKLYIPAGMGLREFLLREVHDVEAGHLGIEKTYAALQRRFFWPQMLLDVKSYIQSCCVCSKAKHITDKPAGLLNPLPEPRTRWSSVTTDMVTGLPSVNGKNAVIVFVDRFTKYTILVPVSKRITAAAYAKIFLEKVVAVHGLPDELISDRDSKFANEQGFWQELMRLLGTKVKLSSAYHPQTDGTTERINRTWLQIIRCFCMENQQDWVKYLPLVQADYNNAKHSSTGRTPNFLVFGREVQTPLDKLLPMNTSDNPAAENFVQDLHEVLQQVKRHRQAATDRMKTFADKHRKELKFEVGDKVYLCTKNLKGLPGKRKLQPRYEGPFEIIRVVPKDAYELQLPPNWKIFPTFHVSLLKPYFSRGGEESSNEQVSQENSTGQQELHSAAPQPELLKQPDKLLNRRLTGSGWQYLIRWKGLPTEEDTWVQKSEIPQELLARFHSEFPLRKQVDARIDDLDTYSSDDEVSVNQCLSNGLGQGSWETVSLPSLFKTIGRFLKGKLRFRGG